VTDPPGVEEAHRAARASLVRTVLVFTPLLLLSLAGVGGVIFYLTREGPSGLILTLMLLCLAVFLTGHQSVQSLRDLRSSPRLTTGLVDRKWSRADLLVLRSFYIYVDRSVFKVTPLIYHELEEGDTVSVNHYPHTNTVISVELEVQGSGLPHD
jgi:hypothetical protein